MSIDLEPKASSRTTVEGPAPSSSPEAPTTPEPPRMPGRRNPKWIALGIVALCLGGLLSFAIYSNVVTERSVVAMSQTVYRGEVIEASDLTRIVIQGETFPDAVPVVRQDSVVGQRAAFDLPAGSVLVGSSVTSTGIPTSGNAVVGLKLATGRAPEGLLLPAAPIRLVALPPSVENGGPADKLTGKTYSARVVDQTPGADGTSIVVNVEVKGGIAATIATLAAQERIAVVRDPGK